MHKHIYELVNAGLEHFIIIICNKIQVHTFSLTHFWHTSGKMLILEQNFELIKLWQLCLAPTHLLYMSQFFKKKKLGFEPKPTHLFGQCHEICSFFSDGFPNLVSISWTMFFLTDPIENLPNLFDRFSKLIHSNGFGVVTVKYPLKKLFNLPYFLKIGIRFLSFFESFSYKLA